jgi:hypothetical protein
MRERAIMAQVPAVEGRDALRDGPFYADGEKIDSAWLGSMAHRLLLELRRQLSQIENVKPEDDNVKAASVRATNLRALGSIEQSFTRLVRSERQRMLTNATRASGNKEDVRAELERRLDKLIAFNAAKEVPEQSKQGGS